MDWKERGFTVRQVVVEEGGGLFPLGDLTAEPQQRVLLSFPEPMDPRDSDPLEDYAPCELIFPADPRHPTPPKTLYFLKHRLPSFGAIVNPPSW